MSVLACDRRGCDNIMCDRLSYQYGYLCEDCFQELVNLGVGTNIEWFMDSRPNYARQESTLAYFDCIFSER